MLYFTVELFLLPTVLVSDSHLEKEIYILPIKMQKKQKDKRLFCSPKEGWSFFMLMRSCEENCLTSYGLSKSRELIEGVTAGKNDRNLIFFSLVRYLVRYRKILRRQHRTRKILRDTEKSIIFSSLIIQNF